MTATTLPSGPPASGSPALSPPARRASRPGWRDPRLAVGLVLVALSVVVGVRVVDGRDETTPVLAAATPLVPGQTLTDADLTVVDVRFATTGAADRYLAAGSAVEGRVVTRPVAAGEMLPRAATTGSEAAQSRLPLAVPLGQVPSTVEVGSVVDVWVTREAATGTSADGAAAESRRLLTAVPVVSLHRGQGLGADSAIRVVVGVADDGDTGRAVRGLAGASVTLVHRPDGS
jgi:hypothetical protein